MQEEPDFATKRALLTTDDAAAVRAVVGRLRIDENLPGEEDFDELLPGFSWAYRRDVVGTPWCVLYELGEDGWLVTLKGLRRAKDLVHPLF